MSVYHYRGKRGDLDLYYEDDMIAVDVTEHAREFHGCEMFVHLDDIDDLIEALTNMRNNLSFRYRKAITTGA